MPIIAASTTTTDPLPPLTKATQVNTTTYSIKIKIKNQKPNIISCALSPTFSIFETSKARNTE
jgi:hypothetical protein